LISVDS